MDTPQNPYQPPVAQPVVAATALGYPPPNQPIEVGGLIGQAFECFKADWAVLVGTLVVSMFVIGLPIAIIMGIGVAITPKSQLDSSSPPVAILLGELVAIFIGFVGGSLVQAGMIKVCIASARRESPTFTTYTSGFGKFLPVLGATLVVAFAVWVGTIACLVPGIILALGLYVAPYFVVDAGLGPIEAVKKSWEVTKGHKVEVFLLALLTVAIVFAGEMACLVGLLVAVPLTQVAHALMYVRLNPRAVEAPPPPPPVWGATVQA